MRCVSHLTVLDLFEGVVGPHGKYGPAVGRQADSHVAAGLQDILVQTLAFQSVPLVHGSVHAAGDQTAVITTPHDGAHLWTQMGTPAEIRRSSSQPLLTIKWMQVRSKSFKFSPLITVTGQNENLRGWGWGQFNTKNV